MLLIRLLLTKLTQKHLRPVKKHTLMNKLSYANIAKTLQKFGVFIVTISSHNIITTLTSKFPN